MSMECEKSMLTSRIQIPPPADLEPEDIFQSSLATVLLDDTQNSHGTPGDLLIYQSPRFGDIKVHLPEHPNVGSGRELFAHYLWNAGVLVADKIEEASNHNEKLLKNPPPNSTHGLWNVRGERVLELGAGRYQSC